MCIQDALLIASILIEEKKAFTFQKYVISIGNCAQVTRIQWRTPEHVQVKFIRNQLPFNASVSQISLFNQIFNSNSPDINDPLFTNYANKVRFLINKEIKSKYIKLSTETVDLCEFLEYVKILLENTVIKKQKLMKFSLDFVQNSDRKWYFLGLHSYKTGDKFNAKRFSLESGLSVPSLKICNVDQNDEINTARICERFIRTTHRRTRSDLYQTNSTKTLQPSSRHSKPTSFLLNLETKSTHQQKLIENEVDKLIGKDQISYLKFMSYQKWIKRREDHLPDMPLEKKYAEKIASAKNFVKRKYSEGFNNLKSMIQSMTDITSHVSLTGTYVAQQATKLLLGKLNKPVKTDPEKANALAIQRTPRRRFTKLIDRIAEDELKFGSENLDFIKLTLSRRRKG
ncbi:unnamed protein product [Blepharisma stoltei]|uniref:Uncharacterized protein n=1 Tax=Blepharisma stoltei TaxID=1481888 RepID=A0AAU9K0P2_9CILI|nr:unnamed protein product [Blepharisma stoltei]